MPACRSSDMRLPAYETALWNRVLHILAHAHLLLVNPMCLGGTAACVSGLHPSNADPASNVFVHGCSWLVFHSYKAFGLCHAWFGGTSVMLSVAKTSECLLLEMGVLHGVLTRWQQWLPQMLLSLNGVGR